MKHHFEIVGENKVSVVIELGLGACLSEWMPLVKKIGESAGVLLYERAGIYHSEASTDKRTPENIARELFELLNEIPYTEKILIIAHSQGGLYAEQFALMYPELVKGLILLDPLSPYDNEFREKLSPTEYKHSGVDKSASYVMMGKLAKLKLGFLTKKILKSAPPFYYYKGFNKEEQKDILSCANLVLHAKTALAEYVEAHDENNLKLLKQNGKQLNIPLVLLTHSSALAIEESIQFGHQERAFVERVEEMWQELMKRSLTLSSDATYICAEHSTHYIHLTDEELVLHIIKAHLNEKV